MATVTFDTKCWEKDWRLLLQTDYLRQMIARCDHPFACRRLIINNVSDLTAVRAAADRAVQRGIIDCYAVADDYAPEVLAHFHLSRADFRTPEGDGYYYSIAELTALYLADTDYLVHFSSDALLSEKSAGFIPQAIALMEKDPRYVVANPTWNGQFTLAQQEAEGHRQGNFYVGQGFSDQCYLVPVPLFRQDIYHYHNPVSERYPKYGGELFEKRVDAYQRECGKYRLTHDTDSYTHRNITARTLWAWRLRTLLVHR